MIENKKRKGVCRNTRTYHRDLQYHKMNKTVTEINKEENQDVLLNVKKAYRLAKGSMHGFQDWCKDKEISVYFFAEKEFAELEGGYLYSAFARSFPEWLKENALDSWQDVEALVKGDKE